MKIVQLITRPQRRGAEIFAIQLSEALLKMGHEVIVIALLMGENTLLFSGKVISLNLKENKKIDLTGFKLLANQLKSINPDIIQANASHTLRIAIGTKIFYSGNYKLIYRNANQISPFLKGGLHKIYTRFLLNRTDGILSVSRASKKDLLKAFGYKKAIEVIPIGVDPIEVERKLVEYSNINLPDSYFLHMGAWVPEKDPLGLLEMYSSVLKSNVDSIPLVFLGSGNLEFEMRNKIKRLELDENVFLIKNQENPFPILKNASALVLSSKIEGLPAVILEAMYLEIPVVAYLVGGIGEVLNSATGWPVEPNDQKSFIEVLNSFCKLHKATNEKRQVNAKRAVLKGFTLDKISKDFLLFYKQIIDVEKVNQKQND